MRRLLVLLSLASVGIAASIDVKSVWNQFKVDYNKEYASPSEELRKFNTFVQNLDKIEKHNAKFNAGLETYEMGINRFADMTAEEYSRFASSRSISIPERHEFKQPLLNLFYDDLPDEVDWRTKGVVTPVRNQGFTCLSCWAFSTVACLESIYAINYNITYDLSEQNLVDCCWGFGGKGCNKGQISAPYKYIKENGIMLEEDYNYTAEDGKCTFEADKAVLKIKDFLWVDKNERALQKAVATVGPIAAAVDDREWYLYKSGILEAKNPFLSFTHGITVVGYGTDNGQDYWLIKNSYGVQFGENGYIRIARNKDSMFGISQAALYPIV